MEQANRIDIGPIRYRQIRDLAGRVLLKYTDGLLPVNPLKVLRSSRICTVLSYEAYEKAILRGVGASISDYFPSQDGCTQYFADQRRYIVFYNHELIIKNPLRLHWTLAHEIGHVVLGHLDGNQQTCIFGDGLSPEEYAVCEQEADYFAGMLLAYPAVMRACRIQSAYDIRRMCWISVAAAESRYRSLQTSRQQPSKIDALVEQHFARVIERRNLPEPPEPDWELFPW